MEKKPFKFRFKVPATCDYCHKKLKKNYKTVYPPTALLPSYYCTKPKKGETGSCWKDYKMAETVRKFLDEDSNAYVTKELDKVKKELIDQINALSVRAFKRKHLEEWLKEYTAALYKLTKAMEALKT